MSNVKAVIIRRSGATMTKRIITNPKSANMTLEGLRASDHLDMFVSAEHDVQQNDEVYYIQDHIDVDNLRGMWNFFGGFRDESGFEQDDVYSAPYTMPTCAVNVKSSATDLDYKWSGHFKFSINATTFDGIEITKKFQNNDETASRVPVMNMSHNFDILWWFKPIFNTGANTTIYDDYDELTDKGLKFQIDTTLDTITITVNDGGVANVMVASGVVTLNTMSLVRLTRQNGVFRLFVNNVEETLTNSAYSSNINCLTNIHFFKDWDESGTPAYTASTGFNGRPMQFRFYNRALTDDEAGKIFSSKSVSSTMKFGGRIWKVENSGTSKKLLCSSFSKEILNTAITADTFSGTRTDTFGTGGARKDNVYYATGNGTGDRVDIEILLADILEFVDGGVYAYFQDEPSGSFQGDFVAEGSFLDILRVLFVMDATNHIFAISPRKILFIHDEVQTNYVISDQSFNVLDSGKDDTGTTNSIVTTGRIQKLVHEFTKSTFAGTTGNWTADVDLTAPPFFYKAIIDSIITVTRDGTEIFSTLDGQAEPVVDTGVNQYKYDSGDSTIKFWCTDSNTHNYVIKFIYYYTVTQAGRNVQFKEDPSSITANGTYHRNISVPQIVSGFDITTFNTNFMEDNKDITERVTVFTSSLINGLLVGQKVYFYYITKGLGTIDGSDIITPQSLVVKSISYSYPAGTTRIELGEFMFNGFDTEKQSADNIRVLDSITGTIKAQ